ncbi:MAG: RimK family alpha-L-glutamate ligase [Staphylothermus sp.]|nr:RimK family alpha-L-glutamate ligase [Staphylothermus sp.]
MKILLIHYRTNPPWSVEELIKACNFLGYRYEYLKIGELDSIISNNEIIVKHHANKISGEGAVVRGLGLKLGIDLFMKRIGVLEALEQSMPVINSPKSITYTRDKWRSLLRLARHGIPVPPTMITENPFSAKRFLEEHRKAVFKPLMGSLGLGSTLINDPDIAFHVTRSLINVNIPSYYQSYLEKPGYDIRVFIVGDRVIGAMKRKSVHWKTNIAQGAIGENLNIQDYPELEELSIKSTKILGLDYAGVDIVYDKNTEKYYVIEVNAFPQWKGLKQATGVDPAIHIIKHLMDKIKR